jgi:HEAT repeat protein
MNLRRTAVRRALGATLAGLLLVAGCRRPSADIAAPGGRLRFENPDQERARSYCLELRSLAIAGDSLAPSFITASLEDRSPFVRTCALELVAPFRDSTTLSRVVRLLADPVRQVRLAAVIALKRSATADSVSLLPLVDLLADSEPEVAAAAVLALGSGSDASAGRGLELRLRDPQAPAHMRARCAEALELRHDPRTLPALRAELGNPNDTVRQAVLRALPAFGESLAVPLLLQSLGGQRPLTRIAAAQALGWLRTRRATARLTGLLSDTSRAVAAAAMNALGQIQDSAAARPLVQSIRKSKNAPVRAALNALVRIGLPALPAVLELLRENRPGLRDAGIEILERIRSDTTLSLLVGALPDWQSGPRAAAALEHRRWRPIADVATVHYLVARRDNFGLFEQGAAASRVLRADLDTGDRQVAENAAIALIGLGVSEAVPRLIEVLGQEGTDLMAAAYINSGLDTLASIGRGWAARHGYLVLSSRDSAGVTWASWR